MPALGVLVLLAVVRPGHKDKTAARSAQNVAQSVVETNAPENPQPARPNLATLSPPGGVTNASAQDNYQGYVAQRSAELEKLAMNDDAASLETILSELDNRDPQLRDAALRATIQFGSRDAIPKLKEVAARTDDPQAKRALEDAAAYLTLPSLTEILDQRRQAANR